MFDNLKVANYPNSLVSPEMFLRHLSRMFTGDVVDGLNVTAGTGLQVVINPGNALIRYTSGLATAHYVSLVANLPLAITAPDASNPRIDFVIIYVDKSVTIDSGTPDGQGVVKAIVVSGTPAATPANPTLAQIQAVIGSTNPYIVVASVRVGVGVTVITNGNITDQRSIANPNTSSTQLSGNGNDPSFWRGLTSGVYYSNNLSITGLPPGHSYSYVRVYRAGAVSVTIEITPMTNNPTYPIYTASLNGSSTVVTWFATPRLVAPTEAGLWKVYDTPHYKEYSRNVNGATGSLAAGATSSLANFSGTLPDGLTLAALDVLQVTFSFAANAADLNAQIEGSFASGSGTSVNGYIKNTATFTRSTTWYSHVFIRKYK